MLNTTNIFILLYAVVPGIHFIIDFNIVWPKHYMKFQKTLKLLIKSWSMSINKKYNTMDPLELYLALFSL